MSRYTRHCAVRSQPHESLEVRWPEVMRPEVMAPNVQRRRMLAGLSAAALMGIQSATALTSRAASTDSFCTLGFSTYGMESFRTERAIRLIADIGYDSIEISVRQGWDADSAALGKRRRNELKSLLEQSGLRLTSLMEHVFPTDPKQQATALDRLKLACDVAHDLSPQSPPLVQTALGSGQFDSAKTRLRDALGQWVRLAESTEITIAIKPHRGGVVSKPDEAVWLFEQLGKPTQLRMVYDYSHYAFRDLPLDQTIQTALPYTSHVAIKDAIQSADRVVFDLPGQSASIDFPRLFALLYAGGYRGDFNCEVSSMVSKKDGYDATEAAKVCYQNMSAALQRAAVPRPTA